MRLIDLPITLRELAVKRQIEEGDKRDVYEPLNEAFTWEYTREEEDGPFWVEAFSGDFSGTLKHKIQL